MTRKQEIKTIRLDPRMFISAPFVECPKCSKKEFGVLSIHKGSYTRRCRECWHTESYTLPRLTKKIVYLDQMAISDMMKLLYPKMEAGKKARIKPVWKQLFEKLDRLVKLQLIICPDSSAHIRESLAMKGYYKPLKRMYEQLSNSASFYDEETIKRFQISVNFKRWIGEVNIVEIDAYDVIEGESLDGWQDRLRISVDLRGGNTHLLELLAKERDEIDTSMKHVFARWQSEKSKTFLDWYEEERSAFGPLIFRSYLESLVRYRAVIEGKAGPALDFFLPSNSSLIVTEIFRRLEEGGIADEKALEKAIEYFRSQGVKEIPYVRISSCLFAALARKAAAGQKKSPTVGTVNDIKTIASLAPYCDAMFIDNEFNSLLGEHVNRKPIGNFLGLRTRFFSQNNITDFLEYLESIEKSASKKHLGKVREVYGDNWGEPYIEMYDFEP